MSRSPFRLLLLLAAPAVLGLAACLVPVASARPAAVDKLVADAEAERVAVIQKVSPAVVAVCIHGGQAVGSGVVIDPEGYALTNHHVVQPTGPIMQCGLADGVLYDAVLVGQDKIGDVALVKLLPKQKDKPFPFVQLGDSDKVRIGDWSLAMGNPFSIALDFTPTVTYGLVSGTNRYEPLGSRPGISEYTDCIQVDTSINPGNSGGPLFNAKGELIGINGRINFEKRVRINSGVGYAISINQIKNFLGHFYAGIDTDHASLGASAGSVDDDSDLAKIVVKQILEDSDAYRRGLRDGDQLISFAGRPMTSTNQYKNILGTFPKEWRVPLLFRRENEKKEVLVRLQNITPAEKDQPAGGPMPPMPPRPMGPGGPPPRPDSPAAKLHKPKPGYTNFYFNEIQRDKLLTGAKKHGDFTAGAATWTAEGRYDAGERKGEMRFEVDAGKEVAAVVLRLNIEHRLLPLEQTDPRQQAEPIGSGGLMMALYHYHRFLTTEGKGFEGEFVHGGSEPFYPPPADGGTPKSLAALRVDADVIRTKHGSVTCKWYFAKTDQKLLGLETFISKDTDPCELYLSDYKDAGNGRVLPHRIEARYGDKRYAVLTVSKYTLK
ncbi:MAG: mucD 4 [Gemmataceae bacterium]|nr:mucD 4 [Gemmataceae bacterium]